MAHRNTNDSWIQFLLARQVTPHSLNLLIWCMHALSLDFSHFFARLLENLQKRWGHFVGFPLLSALWSFSFVSNSDTVRYSMTILLHYLFTILIKLIRTHHILCKPFSGLFPHHMPKWLVIFWTPIGLGLVIFLGAWSWQLHTSMRRKRQ